MNYVYLKEFLENTEQIIYDTLEVDELTRISTQKGGVILMTEDVIVFVNKMKYVFDHIDDWEVDHYNDIYNEASTEEFITYINKTYEKLKVYGQ